MDLDSDRSFMFCVFYCFIFQTVLFSLKWFVNRPPSIDCSSVASYNQKNILQKKVPRFSILKTDQILILFLWNSIFLVDIFEENPDSYSG